MPAGGGTRAADGGAHHGLGGAGDRHITVAVAVHQRARRPVGVDGDPGVVAAGEGGALEGALRLLVDAAGGHPGGAAVTGADESVLGAAPDGEADGTASRAVHVVGVAAAQVGIGAGLFGGALDPHQVAGDTCGVEEAVRGGGAGGVDDEAVGAHVDVPGGHALRRLLPGHRVQGRLGGFQAVQAVGDDLGPRTRGGDLGDGGAVGGGDGEGGVRAAHPGPGEVGAEGLLQPLGDGGRTVLVAYAGSRLVGVQAEVPLHGLDQTGREPFGCRCGGGLRVGRGDAGQAREAERAHGHDGGGRDECAPAEHGSLHVTLLGFRGSFRGVEPRGQGLGAVRNCRKRSRAPPCRRRSRPPPTAALWGPRPTRRRAPRSHPPRPARGRTRPARGRTCPARVPARPGTCPPGYLSSARPYPPGAGPYCPARVRCATRRGGRARSA